jgi:hypothetical protein
MSKLYRSVLWSGLVVAGVAACGDDVTVPVPPAPVTVVHSVSVTPDGVPLLVGATLQMVASVNADAGLATTVTWNTAAVAATGKATLSATGLLTGVAAGAVGIQACSTVNPAVCGGATVTITTTPPATVTSVTVTPGPNVSFVVGQPPVTFVAAVIGTNSPAQTVTWSTASGATNVVSVGAATGIVTVVGAGTEVVKACSTVAPTVCGSSSVNVQVAAPTQVSIFQIQQGGTTVDLSNVSGQVDVTLNVDPGAGSLVKVQVLVDGVVTAEQCFLVTCPVSLRAAAPAAHAVQLVTLPFNTRQVKKLTNGLYIPVSFNGSRLFSAKLFTSLITSGVSSNVQPVVLQNADSWVSGTTPVLSPASTSPSFVVGSTTWYKADVNFVGGANYISFFPVTPEITFSSVCGSSGDAVVANPSLVNAYLTGISFAGTFPCASSTIESAVSINDPVGSVTPGTALHPDDIYIGANTEDTEQVGTAFTVNGQSYYNLLSGGSLDSGNSVSIDTKAPVITPNEIGFRAGCSATIPTPGCWIGSAYNLTADFVVADGGSGSAGGNTLTIFNLAGTGPTVCGSTVFTVASLAENSSPTAYQACAVAVDPLGNTSGAIAGFNAFGVDKTNPTITYAKDPAVATALYTPNSTLAEAIPVQALDWKVNDNNAGLDTATALTVATTGRTLNGTTALCVAINAALNAQPLPGADRFMIPANVIAPDQGCTRPGYYHYIATVKDRAGNSTSDIDRIFGFEPGVPTINALAPSPLYGGGTATTVTVFASHTGASLSAAKVGIWYKSNPTTPTAVQFVFDLGQIFNTAFQTPLFLATPTAGTPFTVAAGNSLAGVVIDSTKAPISAFDSLTAIVRDVFDAFPLTGALVHADTANMVNPLAFIDATKVSVSATVWAFPAIGTPTFSGSGSCTFTYATPTNGPTIPTAVWVVNASAPNQYDVLFFTAGTPTLISDNGTTRLYQYAVSSGTCASLGGALKLVAIKNDGAGLPVGYVVQ